MKGRVILNEFIRFQKQTDSLYVSSASNQIHAPNRRKLQLSFGYTYVCMYCVRPCSILLAASFFDAHIHTLRAQDESYVYQKM